MAAEVPVGAMVALMVVAKARKVVVLGGVARVAAGLEEVVREAAKRGVAAAADCVGVALVVS
mgnify:CR=1 FL=1